MTKTETPATPPASMAVLVTKLSLLAESNREAYRALRKMMWQFVVENSARSDFPSNFS